MFSMRALLLAAAAATGVQAYFDGYRNVSSPTRPLQVRLAYQGATAMEVSWNTFKQLKAPTVHYGLSPDNLDQTARSDVSVTYPTSLTYNNHVNLTGLEPVTTYYYLPHGHRAKQHPYNFTTGRLAGDSTPLDIAVVVDMGTFGSLGLSTTTGPNGGSDPLVPGQHTTIQAISSRLSDFDFVGHVGDIAYADYWLKEEIQEYLPTTTTKEGAVVYEHILNAFFDEVQNISSHKAYMVSPGNHEANCDNGGTSNGSITYTESICLVGQTNFTGYINHWRMPSGPSGGVGNFWYSYDHGMAHFVSIDTETDFPTGIQAPDEGSPEFAGPFGAPNQQIEWLKNDLASVDRTKTPWVIVFGHRPFYVSTSDICTNCTLAFEDTFYKYGVDLYISGHSHVYERNAPIFNNTVDPAELHNPKATWYIVNGAAGHYSGLDTLDDPLEPYSRKAQDSFYSYSTLTFHNCTHLTQTAYDSGTGSVFDRATLYKARTC